MKLLKISHIRSTIEYCKIGNRSMRGRFAAYVIAVIATFIALLMILLNLFGVLNPDDKKLEGILDAKLSSYSEKLESDIDRTAAYGISFAEQLESSIQEYLVNNHISFEDLKDNPDASCALQSKLYDTVYLNMQMAPSSGAFYILNTTVNSSSKEPYYSGIYLKYVNIYSENTVNNHFTIYRGPVSVGKDNNLSFHSGWQNECKTDFFERYHNLFNGNTRYALSSVEDIPETWEKARYVFVPIHDIEENVIGVCGFEMNNLYFQLTHKPTDENLGHTVYAFLDDDSNSSNGQFTANNFTTNKSETNFKISKKNGFSVFQFENEKCIGKTKKISLGNDEFTVAVMITEAQYNKFMREGKLSFIFIFLILSILAFACCVFLSKNYISPLLKKIEQIKHEDLDDEEIKIREIDDLFAFLEEKDNRHEDKLRTLEIAKRLAEEEAESTKSAYEKALKEYELAKSEIEQLSEKHKNEIILEDYEYFRCNLGLLTEKEHQIYELYLQGKNVKQIAEIAGITENTLKFHNKNIYSKLGISSRKQLLKYAALKQQQDRKEEQSK